MKFDDDFSTLTLDRKTFNCETLFDDNPHLIVCRSNYTETLTFNKDLMRFVLSDLSLFAFTDEGGDADGLFAGTCEDF